MKRYKVQEINVLGPQPKATCHVNGGSFQQDLIASHKGWQYAAFYLDHPSEPDTRLINLARRNRASPTSWESFQFDDYLQTTDDGHNTISLGICPSDGTIHLAWDCHNSAIQYRRSINGIASNPERATWSPSSFGKVYEHLPGVDDVLDETTYPRFISLPYRLGGALLFEVRTGMAGLGDTHLFAYRGDNSGTWVRRGTYIRGVENSPYINGLDFDKNGALYVSWCHRGYVPVTRTQASQQAGPNGPENNYNLMAAYSPMSSDGLPGLEWCDLTGEVVGQADISPIMPTTPGITLFEIPMRTGVLNQESQCLSPDGLHVLNRELVQGVVRWIVYNLTTRTKTVLPVPPQSALPPRGKILHLNGRLIALLQDAKDLIVLDVDSISEVGWIKGGGGENCAEVLYDRYITDVLSICLVINDQLVVVDMVEDA